MMPRKASWQSCCPPSWKSAPCGKRVQRANERARVHARAYIGAAARPCTVHLRKCAYANSLSRVQI